MDKIEYKGAEWIGIDLHLHTPGVSSFKLQDGVDLAKDRDWIADEYVKRLKQADIKLCAITDYNGIRKEWFSLIKEKAEKQGIFVLPGVELSISLAGGKYGIHLIVVLEESVDIDGFNTFLHSLDKNPGNHLIQGRDHRDIDSRYELEELIKEIRQKYSCLIIFAHPEEDKGLLKSFAPADTAHYISRIEPDALEYLSDGWKDRLVSTNKIKKDLLNRLAIIETSDPKSMNDIGNKLRDGRERVTYIKLSEFSLSALRLALHDPEVRVRTYEAPEMFHSRITRVDIDGTTFLRNLSIPFNPELNTLIGGRGAGKSAILETIRYALGFKSYVEEDVRYSFISSVLGSGGKVSIEIDRYFGQKRSTFRVKRILGDEPEVFNQHGERLHIKPLEIFDREKHPIIIGQKELYWISQKREFLLSLIDQFIGEKITEIQDVVDKTIKELKDNSRRILELREKLKRKEEYEQQLKNLDSKIKAFESLGVRQKLEGYTRMIEDNQRVSSALKGFDEIRDALRDAIEEAVYRIEEIVENLKRSKSRGKGILEELSGGFAMIKDMLRDLDIEGRFDKIYKENIRPLIDRWKEEMKKAEEDISTIKRQLGKEGLQPEVLEGYTREKTKIELIVKEMRKYETMLAKEEEKRERIKERLRELRYELFNTRNSEIQTLNEKLKGRVKISVGFMEERSHFRRALSNLLKGSGIREDVVKAIIETQDLIDGLILSRVIGDGKPALMERFNLTDKMAERLLDVMKNMEKLHELETLYPDDRIEIELDVDGNFVPLEKLSAGQKATALLLLLFATEDRILILDQPEEDLDNRFIYEDVVKILRELKSRTQLIIATHNANIPVIGDSELILVLDSKDDQCIISNRGSIDKSSIRNEVKRIMEGGEEAFRLRAEKYGGL